VYHGWRVLSVCGVSAGCLGLALELLELLEHRCWAGTEVAAIEAACGVLAFVVEGGDARAASAVGSGAVEVSQTATLMMRRARHVPATSPQ
jgi:hypothetical protein